MIEKIIEFSIRNRFIVILVSLGVVVWGFMRSSTRRSTRFPTCPRTRSSSSPTGWAAVPQEIEDQITYPLSVNLQGLAGVKAVRSSSEFNFSMINIIFDDNIDFYFARQRVLERLTLASTFLPPGVMPYLGPGRHGAGPDLLVHRRGRRARPRRLCAPSRTGTSATSSTPCPAWPQVASAGGFPIEYQIDVDPEQAPRVQRHAGRVVFAPSRDQLRRRRQGHPEGERRVPRPRRRLDPQSTKDIEADRRQGRTRRRARRSTSPTSPHGQLGARIPPQRAGEGRQARPSARW